MWPLAECISSLLVRTPSLQLGVLQSLRSSFQTRSIPSLPRWFIPLVESRVEVQSQSPSPSKAAQVGHKGVNSFTVVALGSYSRGFHFAINCWQSIVVRYLVPGPTPCPEVVTISYIRPAEVLTLFKC